MELSYAKRGDYLLPDLFLAEQPCIGKYGMLRKTFLKRHRPATYTALLLSGVLSKHLEDTQRLAHERVQLLAKRMAEAQGATEALKAANSMEWTARMNNIRSCAEEVVLAEVINAYEQRYLRLDYAERRLILEALIHLRNRLIAERRCADAVNGPLVKVIG